jgi:hypothetical protein
VSGPRPDSTRRLFDELGHYYDQWAADPEGQDPLQPICMILEWATLTLKALASDDSLPRLRNERAEARAQLQWIQDVLDGVELSPFAASFPLVRAVAERVKQKDGHASANN